MGRDTFCRSTTLSRAHGEPLAFREFGVCSVRCFHEGAVSYGCVFDEAYLRLVLLV